MWGVSIASDRRPESETALEGVVTIVVHLVTT